MTDYNISPDEFAYAIDGIVSGVTGYIENNTIRAVDKACKDTKKELRKANPPKDRTGKYRKGWAHTTKKRTGGTYGEVGNRTHAGLVHLLEKGHARTGGGKVPAYEHVAPAAEKGYDNFERYVNEVVDEALK